MERTILQVMARAGEFHALGNQTTQINRRGFHHRVPVPQLTGLQHLFDRRAQAIGIVQHPPVKLRALLLIHIAPLQGLEIKPDRRNGCLEFVSDCIDKAVVMFVAPDFADKETRVEDQSDDNGEESKQAKENQNALTPVEDDPADVQGDGCHQADGQNHEKCDGLESAAEFHRASYILQPQRGESAGR